MEARQSIPALNADVHSLFAPQQTSAISHRPRSAAERFARHVFDECTLRLGVRFGASVLMTTRTTCKFFVSVRQVFACVNVGDKALFASCTKCAAGRDKCTRSGHVDFHALLAEEAHRLHPPPSGQTRTRCTKRTRPMLPSALTCLLLSPSLVCCTSRAYSSRSPWETVASGARSGRS